MKKYIAFLLCFFIISLYSCSVKNNYSNDDSEPNENNIELTSESDNTENIPQDDENSRALEAFRAAIKNEIAIYYPLRLSAEPREIYFRNLGVTDSYPTKQAFVDMDQDDVKELILSYYSQLLVLHFENGLVYVFDTNREAMETIYTDGSFSWRSSSDIFGNEKGISRLSFVNGNAKYQELCRAEGYSNFYLNGIKVDIEQYKSYIEDNVKTPIEFCPFDTSFLDNDETKAIALASEYWGIKDGEFDPETGYRYRIICSGKGANFCRFYLYCFVRNSYYECIEGVSVNLDTGEVRILPDAKG